MVRGKYARASAQLLHGLAINGCASFTNINVLFRVVSSLVYRLVRSLPMLVHLLNLVLTNQKEFRSEADAILLSVTGHSVMLGERYANWLPHIGEAVSKHACVFSCGENFCGKCLNVRVRCNTGLTDDDTFRYLNKKARGLVRRRWIKQSDPTRLVDVGCIVLAPSGFGKSVFVKWMRKGKQYKIGEERQKWVQETEACFGTLDSYTRNTLLSAPSAHFLNYVDGDALVSWPKGWDSTEASRSKQLSRYASAAVWSARNGKIVYMNMLELGMLREMLRVDIIGAVVVSDVYPTTERKEAANILKARGFRLGLRADQKQRLVNLDYKNPYVVLGDVAEALKDIPQVGCLSRTLCRKKMASIDHPKQVLSRDPDEMKWFGLELQNLMRYGDIMHSAKLQVCKDNFVHYLETNCEQWTEDIRLRNKMRPQVVFEWLRGRGDLIWCINMLQDGILLGYSCFSALVEAVVTFGKHEVLNALATSNVFRGCVVCVQKRLADIKLAIRHSASVRRNSADFCFQYVDNLLGRFYDDELRDKSDMCARGGMEELFVNNSFSPYRDRILGDIKNKWFQRGRQWADIHVRNNKGGTLRPHEDALRAVAGGSIKARHLATALLEVDFPREFCNKKISLAFMTDEEYDGMLETLDSRSAVIEKIEAGKLRNLVEGSMSLYLLMVMLSQNTENEFLNSLPGVDMFKGTLNRTKDQTNLRAAFKNHYVNARDYANYNEQHSHEEIKSFYRGMLDVFKIAKNAEMVEVVNKVLICLEDVGVMYEGTFYKWARGLMTGWRHTMLINTTGNVITAEAAYKYLLDDFDMRVIDHKHQGDDTLELMADVVAGPVLQGMLDAAGKVGKNTKQLFNVDRDGVGEFLRIYMSSTEVRASPLRMLISCLSGDLQQPELTASMTLAQSIVVSLNEVRRRGTDDVGGVLLRERDVIYLAEYWGATEVIDYDQSFLDQIKDMRPRKQRERMKQAARDGVGCNRRWVGSSAALSSNTDFGKLNIAPLVLGTEYTGITIEGKLNTQTELSTLDDKLVHVVTNKISRLSKVIDLKPYAAEYATDVIQSTKRLRYVASVKQGFQVKGHLTRIDPERDKAGVSKAEAAWIASVVKNTLRGVRYEGMRDDVAESIAVDELFGGSTRAAEAWVNNNPKLSVNPGMRRSEMTHRGLRSIRTRLRLGSRTMADQREYPQDLRGCGFTVQPDMPAELIPNFANACWKMLRGAKVPVAWCIQVGVELRKQGYYM